MPTLISTVLNLYAGYETAYLIGTQILRVLVKAWFWQGT